MKTDVQVMHGQGCVVMQIEAPVRTAIVLTADEANELADSLRQQAGYARDLALIPRKDTSKAEAHCEACGGPCRDESDMEDA